MDVILRQFQDQHLLGDIQILQTNFTTSRVLANFVFRRLFNPEKVINELVGRFNFSRAAVYIILENQEVLRPYAEDDDYEDPDRLLRLLNGEEVDN